MIKIGPQSLITALCPASWLNASYDYPHVLHPLNS